VSTSNSHVFGVFGDGSEYPCATCCLPLLLTHSKSVSLNSVEVIDAVVDLDEVRAYRSNPARGLQAVKSPKYKILHADYSLLDPETDLNFDISPSPVRSLIKHDDVEEIALAPVSSGPFKVLL